jgi:hypothetical protein
VRKYLSHFPSSAVAKSVIGNVASVPSIFFAVETNKESIVRTWAEFGGDVNAREPTTGLPLLAFAIINAAPFGDTMFVVCTLRSLGVDAAAISTFLYGTNTEGSSDPTLCSSDSKDGPLDHAW